MSRITGSEVANMMEAYAAIYAPQEEVTQDLAQEETEDLHEIGGLGGPQAQAQNRAAARNIQGALNTAGNVLKTVTNPVGALARGMQQATARYQAAGPRSVKGAPLSSATAKTAPTPAKPAPSKFGTTTPKGSSVTSTGVGGLSPADRAAYSAGGGNAAAQRGMGKTTAQVIAQGKANLGRMDQGKPAPAAAKPTVGTTPIKPAGAPPTPTQVTAKKPGMVGSSPEVKVSNVAASNPSSGTTPIKPAGAPPTPTQLTAKKPSLASGIADLRAMRQASQQRIMAQGGTPATSLVQSFDPFDVVMGYLIDEGYADTKEAALKIMANMSEDWRNSILEATYGGAQTTDTPADKKMMVTNADKKGNTKAWQEYSKGNPAYSAAAHLKGV